MKDAYGTEYARLCNLQVGDIIRVDDGFSCMKKWSLKEVKSDKLGFLYIECKKGNHYLTDEDYQIGIYHGAER